MTEEEVMRLLRAVHRAEVEEVRDWLARERGSCLSILRSRALALNPHAATAEESEQMSRCPHCSRLVEQLRRGALHPPLWTTVRWLVGMLEEEEARLMRWHMEDEGCQRCHRLARSPWPAGLAEALKSGAVPPGQVRSWALGTVSTPGGQVTIEETEEGEVIAEVRYGEAVKGPITAVELLGEKTTLSIELRFRGRDTVQMVVPIWSGPGEG